MDLVTHCSTSEVITVIYNHPNMLALGIATIGAAGNRVQHFRIAFKDKDVRYPPWSLPPASFWRRSISITKYSPFVLPIWIFAFVRARSVRCTHYLRT